MLSLKTFFLAVFCVLASLAPAEGVEAPKTVRIGFQKSSTLITILKAQVVWAQAS